MLKNNTKSSNHPMHNKIKQNYDLKTRTSQVIGEILSIVSKKESKKFKVFIPLVLEHTYKCLIDDKHENNVRKIK